MTDKLLSVRRVPFAGVVALLIALQVLSGSQKKKTGDALLAGFQNVALASLSDAVDAVVGERGFMAHDMRPIVAGRFAGRAATALIKPAPPEKATPGRAVEHAVEMIDDAKPGEVGVIVVEGGLDTAGIGGLMGTAAKARGMAGIVVDGGVRDVAELRDMGLLVFGRSVTPATAVGRYASVAKNIPVECAGVTVRPGDIIVAGEDGVVRVPQEKAEAVLKKAQEIDAKEDKMVPLIRQLKSLRKVIQMFNRI
jgi:regulator of RNase E activity RraA